MADLHNTESELRSFRTRLIVAGAFVLFCFSLLLARFIWLQAIQSHNYEKMAEDNRIAVLPLPPERGWIKDRNHNVLAKNYSTSTLEVTPSQATRKLTDIIDDLAKLIKITPNDRKRFKKRRRESKRFESVRLRSHLTEAEIARFSAHRYRFPSVELQTNMLRQYPHGSAAEHAVGYIAKINQRDVKRLEEMGSTTNYKGTKTIGRSGLERKYESMLHGKTGYKEVEVSARGRAMRTLSHIPPSAGDNLILTIDIGLQKVIEKAFGKHRGALVAIEPTTGDILAYVSMPTFDPNLFIEGIDQKNWDLLNLSLDRPLLNRPISGTYPPGSTYKPFMALAALTMGIRTPQYSFLDKGYLMLGKHRFRDQNPEGHGRVNLYKSIVESCDTYYYMLANEMGVDAIRDFMTLFGFGEKTGIDLLYERKGVLPSTEWKKRTFKTIAQKKWYAGDTVSLGIGQGYNSFTPMQLTKAMATLANDGVVMKPRLVRAIEDSISHKKTLIPPTEENRIKLDPAHLALVKRAMIGVPQKGTAEFVFKNANYISAGKTGTAQVVGIKQNEKYDAETVKERRRDHSLYVAYAPANKPTIALSIIVENGGFGAATAAPIAKKALDYYLKKNTLDSESGISIRKHANTSYGEN